MNKKELLAAINAKKKEVVDLVNSDKIEEATKAKDELKKLQAKFDLLEDIEEEDQAEMEAKATKGTAKKLENKVDSVKAFADAARRGFYNAVEPNKEGVGEKGGYVVPEDIQTRINKYKEAEFSLLDLIDVEKVTTNKGSRTYQKKSQKKGFSKVAEGGKIGGMKGPEFERIDYLIEKFGGYFPVTDELLSDSDQNIVETLIEWIAGESRATDNVQILEKIKTNPITELSNIDGIQRIIITVLGAAYANTSKVITNDDGLLYLSTLKDSNGNYLLRSNNNEPMKKTLAVGAMYVPVEPIPNGIMPSDTSTAGKRGIPFVIGDLYEGIKKFDRQSITIKASDVASVADFNAFEEDLNLYRAIVRVDYRIKDADAFVNGVITIDDTAVAGE